MLRQFRRGGALMSDKAKRVKPSEASNILPMREQGKAVVQPASTQAYAENFDEYIYSGEAIQNIPPTEWLLRGRLVKRGLAALYAPAGVGKSFVAVEAALCAALGEQFWHEYFPKDCRVLYFASERVDVIGDRVKASCKKRGVKIPANLFIVGRPRPLQAEGHSQIILDICAKFKPHFIIFDTFAKMTLGANENDSAEAGLIVENFAQFVEAAGTQAGGLIVHHAGKDNTKGLRGSTALIGALDAVWKLEKKEKGLTLSIEKLNAGDTPLPANFRIVNETMPDPEDKQLTRQVGVLVSAEFAEVAQGIEGKLLELLCDGFEEGASKSKLHREYNRAWPSEGDAQGQSERTIGRALNKLVTWGSAEMLGKAAKTIYKAKPETIAKYRAKKAAQPT